MVLPFGRETVIWSRCGLKIIPEASDWRTSTLEDPVSVHASFLWDGAQVKVAGGTLIVLLTKDVVTTGTASLKPECHKRVVDPPETVV
jgi:hypothetical protein